MQPRLWLWAADRKAWRAGAPRAPGTHRSFAEPDSYVEETLYKLAILSAQGEMMKDLDSIDNSYGMILLRAAEKANPALSVCLGFVLIGAIGLLDYLTGYELSFAMFYFLPLALVAWKGGRWLGI